MSVQTDPLLTTALEKLLYLESRLDAAEAAREEAARDSERHRIAAQAARQALVEWQRRATDAEVEAESAQQEVGVLRSSLVEARQALNDHLTGGNLLERLRDTEERLLRYDREREAWLDRMVALGRLRSEGDELDLGSFIAELRAELLALRRGDTDRRRATVSDRPHSASAAELLQSVPGGHAEIDVEALIRRTRLSRPERTLASLCARDLKNASASVRRRAAERLVEGRITALTPLIAQRLPSEQDPHTRLAFVKLLEDSDDETAPLALNLALADEDPRVRAAAVEAMNRRDAGASMDALRDPSPAVRRRALALLPRTTEALDALASALRDEDASVRHVAALSLSKRMGAEVEALLQVAAESADPEVRIVAKEALVRRGAEVAPPVVELTPAPQVEPVTPTVIIETPPAPVDLAPEPEPIAEPEPLQSVQPVVAVAPPVEEEPEPTPSVSVQYELDERIVDEIRTALRGRTIEELMTRTEADESAINASLARLTAAGTLVWRGRKLYLP